MRDVVIIKGEIIDAVIHYPTVEASNEEINEAIRRVKIGQPKVIRILLNTLADLFTYPKESLSEEEVLTWYEFLMKLNSTHSKYLAQEVLAHAGMSNKEAVFNLIIKLRCL